MIHLLVTLTHSLRQRFGTDAERGAAAVEYGMLVALIAAVVVGTVATLGPTINAAFQEIVTALNGAIGA